MAQPYILACLAVLEFAMTVPCWAQVWTSADREASNRITRLVGDAQAAEARHDDDTACRDYTSVLQLLKEHPTIAPGLEEVGLTGLAQAEERRGNYARAAELVERRLAIMRRRSSSYGPAALGAALVELLRLYSQLGRDSDAQRTFNEAVEHLEKCSTTTSGTAAVERQAAYCRIGRSAARAWWAWTLFKRHEDATAEPLLRKLNEAPEAETAPQLRLICLRLYAMVLARNGREKEAGEAAQKAADYEKQHPDAVAQTNAALAALVKRDEHDPTRKAILKLNEMGGQLAAGTLPANEDLSSFGAFADALTVFRDALYSYQQEVLKTRSEIEKLDLIQVLTPAWLATPEGRKTSHEKLRSARLLQERLVVSSQNMISETEQSLRQRATEPYTLDRRAAFEFVLSSLVLSLGRFQKQMTQLETESLQLLKREDEFVAFLDSRAGHFSIENGKLVFSLPEDDTTYNTATNQLQEWGMRVAALRQQLLHDLQQTQSDSDQLLQKR